MRNLQQPGGHLALKSRMKLTRAVEAALWTNHEPCSVSQCSDCTKVTGLPIAYPLLSPRCSHLQQQLPFCPGCGGGGGAPGALQCTGTSKGIDF